MRTFADQIESIIEELPRLNEFDVAERAQQLHAANEASTRLRQAMNKPYSEAVSVLANEVGATKAARILGISRGRVYQLIEIASTKN